MTDLLAGRYRLLGKLGDGGMATVYRAEDTVLGRTVAVKVLREQFAADRGFRERFQQEARAAAVLSHPHVVSLYDVGDAEGRPFLIMECVDGPNLKEVLRHGPLPPSLAVQIGIQICEAVAAAHAHGIVHRDVKPQNVLVQGFGTEGHSEGLSQTAVLTSSLQAKITDFGIARAQGAASISDTGQVLGSVHYLAPEQARGKPATPASDIYSIGVVLYEMLTGRPPFESETVVGVALQHVQEPPPSLRSLNPQVPSRLESIVLQAMTKEPDQRYGSAEEMGRTLQEYLDLGEGATMAVPVAKGSPLSAPVPRAAAVAARPARVQPAAQGFDWLFFLLAMLTTVFVLGLLGLGLVVYQTYFGRVPGIPTQVSIPTLPPAVLTPSQPPPTPIPTPTASPEPTPTSAPRAAVPSVLGLPAAQARSTLEGQGLAYRQEGEAYSDRFPAGSVISQTVAAAQEVAPGTIVGVTLSKGPAPTPTPSLVEIPALVGASFTDAANRLQARGLSAVRVDEATQKVEPGIVFQQEPVGGQRVAAGSKVTLWVGKALPRVVVPNVIGKSEGEAISMLDRSGLKLWRWGVNYQGHADLPEQALAAVPIGAVLSTDPPAGTEVPPGTEVQLAVRKD